MTLKRYSSGTIIVHGHEFDVLLQETDDGKYILHSDLPEIIRKAKVEAINELCKMLKDEINDDDVASEYLLERISTTLLKQLTTAPAGESEKDNGN